MTNGRFRTFDEFGSPPWNSTLSASAQRAAVQSAFDSGEPLLMPNGETVLIDGPLNISNSLHLMGHGCDVTVGLSARSQFRCPVANTDMIRVLASNVVIEKLHLYADAMGGRGFVIGDGTVNASPYGTILTNVSTGANLSKGVEFLSGQKACLTDCFLDSQDAAISRNNLLGADQGDDRIRGGELNAFAPHGVCLLFRSGGGLIFEGGTKFLYGYNHIKGDWTKGGSGTLIVKGCSFENCQGPISVDLDGNQPLIRVNFSGNNWGNSSIAFVVRNFQPNAWLRNLIISHNNIDIGAALPAMDIGSAAEVSIEGNVIDGGGVATVGIVLRRPCEGSVGTNTIRNLSPSGQKILNADGANVNVAPFQG